MEDYEIYPRNHPSRRRPPTDHLPEPTLVDLDPRPSRFIQFLGWVVVATGLTLLVTLGWWAIIWLVRDIKEMTS